MAVTGSPDLGNQSLVNNRTRASVNKAFDNLVLLATSGDKVWPLIPNDVKLVKVRISRVFPPILETFRHNNGVSFEIWNGSSGNLSNNSGTMIFPTIEFVSFSGIGRVTLSSPEMINSKGSRFQIIGQGKIKYVYDHAEKIMDISSIPVGTVIVYNHDASATSCVESIMGEVKKALMANGEIGKMKRALTRSRLSVELTLVTGKIASIIGNSRTVVTELRDYLHEEDQDGIDPYMLIKSKILGILGRPNPISLERAVDKDVLLIVNRKIIAGTLKKYTYTDYDTGYEGMIYSVDDIIVDTSSDSKIYPLKSGFNPKMVNDLISTFTKEGPETLHLDIIQILIAKMGKWSDRKTRMKRKSLKKLP